MAGVAFLSPIIGVFMKYSAAGLVLLLLLFSGSALAETLPRVGTVTMIDLGAKSCIPCKMMAPILEKLEAEYRGKADVVFIDVWQNPDEGKNYGIRAIPTQIFYNKKSEEVGRHEGFLDEKSIRDTLEKLLAE
ncbi:thioredoxin family protein [Desulfovibrio sp.]|uniref:thioredoxin family protein n=1 Tax=Desulfovibrio sp. TaxID=885 RepID=UPI0025BBC210|nr:thioredoxin family protein [Desulfovibrio sp.]